MKAPTWWRAALIAAAWGMVAWHLVSELSGRSAHVWHYDLRLLFNEQAAFYEGRYPHEGVTPTPPGAQPVRSDYPPSSLFLAVPWLPPGLGWNGTRAWFALCQVAAGAVIVVFMWRLGRSESRGLAWLLAGAVLAMTGLRADLIFGNYALLMTVMLVGLYGAAQHQRPVWVVAALTEAMLKPQMGWLFTLPFLTRRGWKILAGVAAALAISALAACAWTGISPNFFLRSGYSESLTTISTLLMRHSLVTVLVQWGLTPQTALVIAATGGVAWTLWALRTGLAQADTLTRFAFVGLVNRICTYHNTCDDLLLVFALAVLGRRAWREGTIAAWLLLLALIATVWAPSAVLSLPPSKVVVVGAWLALAISIQRRGGGNGENGVSHA